MQKEQLRTQNSPWYSGIHDKKPQLRNETNREYPILGLQMQRWKYLKNQHNVCRSVTEHLVDKGHKRISECFEKT